MANALWVLFRLNPSSHKFEMRVLARHGTAALLPSAAEWSHQGFRARAPLGSAPLSAIARTCTDCPPLPNIVHTHPTSHPTPDSLFLLYNCCVAGTRWCGEAGPGLHVAAAAGGGQPGPRPDLPRPPVRPQHLLASRLQPQAVGEDPRQRAAQRRGAQTRQVNRHRKCSGYPRRLILKLGIVNRKYSLALSVAEEMLIMLNRLQCSHW